MVFDNSKIESFVRGFQAHIPFRDGIRRTVEWFAADEERQHVDTEANQEIDHILKVYAGTRSVTC